MRLISWNVNGVRAAVKKGFLDWLEHEQPDICCIQETNAHTDQLADDGGAAEPDLGSRHAAHDPGADLGEQQPEPSEECEGGVPHSSPAVEDPQRQRGAGFVSGLGHRVACRQ